MSWSTVYRHAANPEVFFDAANLVSLQSRLVQDVAPPPLAELLERAREWAAGQTGSYAGLLRHAAQAGREDAVARSMLSHSAALGGILGCCLHGMSAPGVFEDRLHLELLALLAQDVGVGLQGGGRHDQFHALLRRFGLAGLALQPEALAARQEIDDDDFALPAVLLALTRRSDAFGPELCGIDLVLRHIGILPPWAALRPGHDEWIDWSRLDPGGEGALAARADALAERIGATDPAAAARLAGAAAWMLAALERWNERIWQHAAGTADAPRAMAGLMRAKASDAAVYHHEYKLGGCPLAAHFEAAASDPAPLLAALAGSRLIVPGASGRSVLVNGLVGPNGKMFRVFRDEELDVIRHWIDSLPEGTTALSAADGMPHAPAVSPAPRDGDSGLGLVPGSIREAYYVLQGRALAPATRRFAVRYVQDWLAAADSDVAPEAALPDAWPREGLAPWLTAQHVRNHKRFQQGGDDMPSREQVIDSSLQLAPLLCIDGAWLQGFTDIGLASSPVGHALFEIYWDELGNGDYALNHPKIYRDLLRQMGIELAPTGSRAFAHDERLRDESFRLPVFWLCLGKLVRTFMPEIVGMNLAMELSGVGGGYRSAHRYLKHYGFSTRFVDLHNTIDNVSSGHSAWAAQAVDEFMLTVDVAERAQAWERVRTGYRCMSNVPAGGWRRQLRHAQGGARVEAIDGSILFHHYCSHLETATCPTMS